MSAYEYSPYDFAGAQTIGDGVTDAWSCWMQAITRAQSNGGTVIGDPGLFSLSQPLAVTDRMRLRGCGYDGDRGAVYAGRDLTSSAGMKGCVLLPKNCNGVTVASQGAVQLEGFQISYPSRPSPGVSGMRLDSAAGATAQSGVNTDSIIRDIFISGADYGLDIFDWYDFRAENIRVQDAWTISAQLQAGIFPSYGDSTFDGCKFYGAVSYHIALIAGGGLRVSNSKLNASNGAANACSVMVYAMRTDGSCLEPFVFTGGSVEGATCGFRFQRAPGSNATIGGVKIDTQIFVGGAGNVGVQMLAAPDGGAQWISGAQLDNLILLENGGVGYSLDGVATANCDGSTITVSSGSATAVIVGPNASNIVQGAIAKSPGVV